MLREGRDPLNLVLFLLSGKNVASSLRLANGFRAKSFFKKNTFTQVRLGHI